MNAVALSAANPPPAKCPWCATWFPVRPGGKCSECGGPLTTTPGAERGDAPPPAPRVLPAAFKRQVMFSKNIVVLVGLGFMVVGVPLIAAYGSGVPFAILGFLLWRTGRKAAAEQIAVLEAGVPVEATLLSVSIDSSESINGEHPFRLHYAFEIQGQRQVGSSRSWDLSNELRQPGEPLWVVYDPSDPKRSSLWPPHA